MKSGSIVQATISGTLTGAPNTTYSFTVSVTFGHGWYAKLYHHGDSRGGLHDQCRAAICPANAGKL